jgi:serine/threonine-protein kinase CHEK1
VDIHERLQHRNIIEFLDWFQEDNFLYINMELAAGRLDEKIRASVRGLPSVTCRQYFQDLILGVEYLHFMGIAHRDIKSENLLIGTDGYIKISDFGVSTIFRTDQGPAKLMTPAGTDEYTAPEVQMPGTLGYDPEPADIWSCGIVLVEMLTKKLPWRSTFGSDYINWRTNRLQEPFDLIDEDVLPLIYMMLDEDSWQRATIHEIKEHSWFPKK